ncbi:MAG: hypothetical protein OZ935_13330 [Pseudomonadota bacterium]|nr:hypothetical protein [Pseudomonadota bacterium]
MLLTRFQVSLSDQSTQTLTLEIGRIRGGSIGDYVVIERDDEDSVLTQTEFLQYPRWSEHVSGLAGRCARNLWKQKTGHRSPAVPSGACIESARIDIGLGSHEAGLRHPIERIEYVRIGFAPRVRIAREHWPAYEWPAPDKLPRDTRLALVQLLTLAAWGDGDIPEMPAPFDVPVHKGAGCSVVCFGDIPEPARRSFEHWMSGKGCPVVPELGSRAYDCAFVWDWRTFLGD